MKLWLHLSLLFIISSARADAQYWSNQTDLGLFIAQQDASCSKINILDDVQQYVTAPLHWSVHNGLYAAFFLATAVGFYQYDSDLQHTILKNRTGFTHHLADGVRLFGDVRIILPLLLGGYAIAHWNKNEPFQCTAKSALKSVVFASSVTLIIKFFGQRHRPYTGSSPTTWDGPKFRIDDDFLSMPSGHATVSFAAASVFSSIYAKPIILPVFFYSLAALTAWSRVHDNLHWTSDVWIGTIIGCVTGRFFAQRHWQPNDKTSITPLIQRNRIGIVINLE